MALAVGDANPVLIRVPHYSQHAKHDLLSFLIIHRYNLQASPDGALRDQKPVVPIIDVLVYPVNRVGEGRSSRSPRMLDARNRPAVRQSNQKNLQEVAVSHAN